MMCHEPMREPNTPFDRIIRKPELLAITGVSAATIYRWIAEGSFPRPVRLGSNSSGWRASHVQDWLDSRMPVGRGAPDATGDHDSRTAL